MQVSSKAQTLLVFNKGDDLALDLGIENVYDGSGNVTSTTNPSVSLTAPEEVTESYVVSFNISANTFVYTTEDKTPELILTILDAEGTPITSIEGLTYISEGDVTGFDITEASGLYEILNGAEITANNNTTTDEWEFTLTFMNLDTDQVLNTGKDFDAKILMSQDGTVSDSTELLSDLILLNNGGVDEIEAKEADFTKAAVSQAFYDESTSQSLFTVENGMYSLESDYGTSYYFRGAVENNWVKFGGYYWRIIRIDENGNIKLIYSGSDETGPSSGSDSGLSDRYWFNSYTRPEYVGYVYEIGQMHGISTDSSMKKNIEEWYNNNLETEYDDFITATNYCVNRKGYSNSSYTNEIVQETFSSSITIYYDSSKRLSEKTPILECLNDADNLELKVGLISVDELMLAGLNTSATSDYYLNVSYNYWTISPYRYYYYFSDSKTFSEIYYASSGSLSTRLSSGEDFSCYGIDCTLTFFQTLNIVTRPTITLKSNVVVLEGNGSLSEPYDILA